MSTTTTTTETPHESLAMLLRLLKLPTMGRLAEEVARTAEQQGWPFQQYLRHLAELEVQERRRRRIARNLRDSNLPADKTLATLDRGRLPATVARRLAALCEGDFAEHGANVLIFGLPGRGKTHVACAIGHELVRRGRRVYFTATYALVQRLLAARRDLRLERELEELDGYDAVICDDLGYVQQSRDEMEVLFTFLAERYERKSVLITSNLVFSEWDKIFKDPMTTMAAIDRLIHHAVILEMVGASVRADEAEQTNRNTNAGARSARTRAPGATTNGAESSRVEGKTTEQNGMTPAADGRSPGEGQDVGM
jgi:DNA replication protein DnaC